MTDSGGWNVRERSSIGLVVVLSVALALALSFSMLSAQEAGAAKLTACVNKKTGAMRLVSGKKAKKCPRGWRKVTWEKGPGQTGLQVVSADGKLVGTLVGMTGVGTGVNAYTVLRNGGIYSYLGGGQLYPTSSSGSLPEFKTADCSGPAYVAIPGVQPQSALDFYTGIIGGPFRMVFRTFSPLGLGDSIAWKFLGTTETVAAAIPTYKLQTDGTCVSSNASFTGTLFQFENETAPPDFKGPLKIR